MNLIDVIASRLGYRFIKSSLLEDLTTPRWSMRKTLQRVKGYGIMPNTVIDIGAAEGVWSKLALQVFPTSHYLLVEPLAERKETLSSFAQNKQYIYAPYALGEENKKVVFNICDDLDGSGIYGNQDKNSRIVQMQTLDSLIEKNALPSPFLIKFDTHGYEIPILKGAMKTLENTCCIVMETYNFRISPTAKYFWEMADYMNELGFRIADIADPYHRRYDGAFWQIDIVWLKKNFALFNYERYK